MNDIGGGCLCGQEPCPGHGHQHEEAESVMRGMTVVPPLPSPDMRLLESRKVIGALLHYANQVGRMQLEPTRDGKMNAMLGNQALLMHALAFLLDAMVIESGGEPGLKFESAVPVTPENGNRPDGPVLVRP